MKKRLFWLSALLVLAACSEIQLPSEESLIDLSEPGSSGRNEFIVKNIAFTAHQEGDETATRTVLDEDGEHVLWLPGDMINIFHDGSEPACFVNTKMEEAAIATFEGSITTHIISGGSEGSDLETNYYWGLYPYDAEASYEDGAITTTLPSEQKAVAGTFDDDLFITVGRSETTEMPFFNVCSGIKFTLDRGDISSVTLTADGGQDIAGKFSVAFDDETGKPVVKKIIDGSSSITLTPSDGVFFKPYTWYYVVTLPQTLENEGGFTFTFTMNGEGIAPIRMRSTATLSLNRSAFRKTAMKINTAIKTDIETAEIRSFLEDPEIDDLYRTDMEYSITKGGSISCSAEPVRFTWAATGARTLYISDNEDYNNAKKISIGASATVCDVYNLIPGVNYYCRTISASGTTYWETSFVPVGPFRAISVSGTGNSRDLGGWVGEDGRTVRYGKLFRGKAPSSSSTELLNLGVGVEMDLRGYPNTSGNANTSCPFGAEFINRPVCQFMYAESSSSGGSGGGGNWKSSDTKAGTSADDYQQAIREVIQCLDQGKGVFFHCIGGADRTGTLSYLILALLGVDEASLCKEYELTKDRTRDNDDERPFKQLVFYLKTFTSYTDPETGEYKEAETLQDMVTFWALTKHEEENDQYGPFEPLTMKEINLLKSLMLE